MINLVGCLMQLPKAPFCLLRLWYETGKEMLKTLKQNSCTAGCALVVTCSPFAVLVLALEPVAIVLLCVLGPITGLAVGFMWAAVIGYKTPAMCDAFYLVSVTQSVISVSFIVVHVAALLDHVVPHVVPGFALHTLVSSSSSNAACIVCVMCHHECYPLKLIPCTVL